MAGSTGTMLLGNNDSNWGVGRYTDASGVTHGLFFVTPDDLLTYDYPGSTFTSLNGINEQGLICGYYVDAAGITHGFVASLNPNVSSKPNTTLGNISTRLRVETGDNVLIGGFIITGAGEKSDGARELVLPSPRRRAGGPDPSNCTTAREF